MVAVAVIRATKPLGNVPSLQVELAVGLLSPQSTTSELTKSFSPDILLIGDLGDTLAVSVFIIIIIYIF